MSQLNFKHLLEVLYVNSGTIFDFWKAKKKIGSVCTPKQENITLIKWKTFQDMLLLCFSVNVKAKHILPHFTLSFNAIVLLATLNLYEKFFKLRKLHSCTVG